MSYDLWIIVQSDLLSPLTVGPLCDGAVWEGLLKDLFELLLCVDYLDLERGPWHVHPGPLDAEDVQSRLCGVVATQDGPVLLAVSVHLHLETSCVVETKHASDMDIVRK